MIGADQSLPVRHPVVDIVLEGIVFQSNREYGLEILQTGFKGNAPQGKYDFYVRQKL